jgi:MoaA/NifB/PqqE/SkfB family radical SAM enzyme
MKRITSVWPHQDSIKIEWNLGKRCNLDCTYCPAEIHDNFSPHTDISILKKAINSLQQLNKPIRVSLTGGEPCVHPKIEDLLAYMRPRVTWINITSNVTRTANWYASQASVDHWVFSLHFEDNDWNNRVEKIIKINVDNPNIKMQVNVMSHHNYMDRVRSAVQSFDNNNIPYVIRRIRWTEQHDLFDDQKYHAEDLDWIISKTATALPNVIVDNKELYHANDIIKKHLNQFKNWKCSIGIESLMINWDGEVYRATCRVGGSLGNIYNETFKLPKTWSTCTRQWCTCAADIPLTKVKND